MLKKYQNEAVKTCICLFMAIIMAFTFVACGSTGSNENTLKVGFIYLQGENSHYDLNFINAAKTACKKLGVEYVEKTNIPESEKCYEAAADLVACGCSIVFADSFGHESFIIQAAKQFPNVQFCHGSGTMAHTEKLSNFHNAFASIYEGWYLVGVSAGMKLNEMIEAGKFSAEQAKIGYVGSISNAETISAYSAFFLGVRSICPTVTMEVQFTGSWDDENAEKKIATNLIDRGCKLISQNTDMMGAPIACENAGIPNVAYNGSTVSVCPNTCIISTLINWEPYFEYIIKCVKENKAIDVDWTGTIATGSVVLTDINERIAAKGTADKISEIKAKLIDDSLHVFETDTFTVDGSKLNSYLADVDTDAYSTKDTEVIKDGYFHESEYRSAPYFDITVDGITIL